MKGKRKKSKKTGTEERKDGLGGIALSFHLKEKYRQRDAAQATVNTTCSADTSVPC